VIDRDSDLHARCCGCSLLVRPDGVAVDHPDIAIMAAVIAPISPSHTPALAIA
jgi:hypothetical protein